MTDAPIGITTTIPCEIAYAAGRPVLDVNNLFVADENPAALVERAERNGFPQSACAWIKGLYGTIHKRDIRTVVGVVEGDCSDTGAMLDVLRSEGIEIIPFAFPHSRTEEDITREMERLARALGTNLDAAEKMKIELDEIRKIAGEIDAVAGETGAVESGLLFDALLTTTDFLGDPNACRTRLEKTLAALGHAPTADGNRVCLGCLGVPPILFDLWEIFESYNTRFVWQEVPLQFSRAGGIGKSLAQSYLDYTYPYDSPARVKDILAQIKRRKIKGIVHYVQSFCHRQITDRLIRESVDIPILTIEADRPGKVDERTRTRIEAFAEQLTR